MDRQPEWDVVKELRRSICYKAQSWAKKLGVPRFNILIFGQIGSGKSTVVNSICTALEGSPRKVAHTGNINEHVTCELRAYCLDLILGLDCPICLLDTWGYEVAADPAKPPNYKHGDGEFEALLDGRMKVLSSEKTGKTIMTPEEQRQKKTSIEQQAHCVILVMQANAADNSAQWGQFFAKTLERKKRVVVPVTRLDTISNYQNNPDILLAPNLEWSKIQAEIRKHGVNASDIIPFPCLWDSSEPTLKQQILILRTLSLALQHSIDHIQTLREDAKYLETTCTTNSAPIKNVREIRAKPYSQLP